MKNWPVARAAIYGIFVLFALSWSWDYLREFSSVQRWRKRFRFEQVPSGGLMWLPRVKPQDPLVEQPPEDSEEEDPKAKKKKKKKKKRRINFPTPADIMDACAGLWQWVLGFAATRSFWPAYSLLTTLVALGFCALLVFEIQHGVGAKAHIIGYFPTVPEFQREKCAGKDSIYADKCDPDYSAEALEWWPDILVEMEQRAQMTYFAAGAAGIHLGLAGFRTLKMLGFHPGTQVFGKTISHAAEDLLDAVLSTGFAVVAVAIPCVLISLFVLPGSLGEWEWYFQLPMLRFFRGFIKSGLFPFRESLPTIEKVEEAKDQIIQAIAEAQRLAEEAAAGGEGSDRRLQKNINGEYLPGPELAPRLLPYTTLQTVTTVDFAVRGVLAIVLVVFIVLVGNFFIAVIVNAYLRALGDDGDPCKVIRQHESIFTILKRTLYTEYRYNIWYCRSRKDRKNSAKIMRRIRREEKRRERELKARGKLSAQEQELAALADAERPDIEVPARLWRILPYEYPRKAMDEIDYAYRLRWTVWSRLVHSKEAKQLLEHFLCPYTQDLVYPSYGGDATAFTPYDANGLIHRAIDLGVDDPEALGNVMHGLYGTEVVPTGIRRSTDGYYHGQGEGRESEREIPWEPSPFVGTTSHIERALGYSEARLGSEMRKLTHAQAMLHEMMCQMQRQAEGMDKAQQVILQYLVNQQAKRDMDAKMASITAKQTKHFFPGGKS